MIIIIKVITMIIEENNKQMNFQNKLMKKNYHFLKLKQISNKKNESINEKKSKEKFVLRIK